MPGRRQRWSTSSRRLGALFLIVLVPAAATLVWLGLQLAAQDRRLLADRERERRDTAADLVVRALSEKLAGIDALLTSAAPAPDGVVTARLSPTAASVSPAGAALWLPVAPSGTEANAALFASAEVAELRKTGDRGRAVYQRLRGDPDAAVRAGALQRLARLQRTSGEIDAALETYRALASLKEITINSIPADLVARRAIADLLDRSGDRAAVAREAQLLRDDLIAGRWTLDEGGWTLAVEDVERWSGSPVGVSDRRAISRALDQIRRRGPSSGRQTFRIDDVSVLAQWRADGDNVAAFLLPPTLVSDWVHQALPADFASADAVLIADESGSAVVGTKPDNSTGLATRLATATGLPWNVTLKPIATSSADMAALAGRSRLLVTGLAAIVILLSGGGYILWRGVRREVALARIQTDFVAAVSHEFRTPLTSLQHVTELLDEDDELPREDKRTLYASLGRSTDRLRGLVESLLDFARMEEGRRPYDLRPLDVSSLARDVVADFTRHAPAGARITLDTPSSGPVYCRADAAALKHAAWNLLDNAVKYSPEPHLVRVSVKEEEGAVAIAVADQGYGIPAGERRSVFDKFVRGSSAQGRGIKGTGLGLALVSHIVAAHHGTLDLQSEEGKGSTFTIILPCLAS